MLKRLSGRDGPLGVFVEYPVLLRLAAISVCAEIAWGTLIIVLQYHFKDDLLVGEPHQLIGSRVATVTLAFVACETLLKVPMGALSDRIGPRRVIYFALTIAAISPVLMAFVHVWYLFVPLRMMDGVGAAALWPSMSALMARSVPRNAKSSAMSVFNGAYCLGLAIGPIAGLYLGNHIGNAHVFPLCSLLLIAGLLIARTVLHSGVGDKTASKEEQVGIIGEDFPAKHESILKGRPMLTQMMVLYALSQTGVGMLASTMVLYLDGHFSIKEADLPKLIAGPAFAVAFIALPLGRLADRVGRPRAVWASYVMATVGMLMVAFTSKMPHRYATDSMLVPSLLVFGAGMLLLVGSYILGTPAWLGLTSLQVDDTRQAHALSLMQSAQGAGLVIGAGMVAAAGPLLIEWRRVTTYVHTHAPKLPRMPRMPHFSHLPHLPQLPHIFPTPSATPVPAQAVQVIVPKDAVPISVWLWVAAATFGLCLIGTILFVREPEHSLHSEETAASSKQPLEISGV